MFLCMDNFCLTLQEDKLKKPLSDVESWKLARERSDLKDGESQYYGKTEEHLESYTQNYQKLHPDVPVSEVAQSQMDDTAVVAIQGKSHGRYPSFDGLITPSISYTRLRATNPSQLESTGHSQPPLARQHAAYKSFVEHRNLEVREYLQRVKANDDYNRRMMTAMLASWSNRTDPPQMGPPPPPAGEPPHVPTFDEWVALGSDSPGTGGSTPAPSTPVTPIWQSDGGRDGSFGGGGLGGGGFGGGGFGGGGLA
ncbi:uncharacterized protein [Aegilops tauschii subsp. strangulata]|uniref:uncharacterized protein n=1 Tax=Aegilops tauschii subsp. strangulata TaxID=200361 RepID=UPI001ABCF1F3|nr:androgen receptor-like [Aegilops tauschii subsp. strangulata]